MKKERGFYSYKWFPPRDLNNLHKSDAVIPHATQLDIILIV